MGEDDRIQTEDFNGDNAKVESALAAKETALEQSITAQANRLTQKIYTGTRVGTNTDGDSSFRFPPKPLLVIICAETEFLISLPAGRRAYVKASYSSSGLAPLICTLHGSLFTWTNSFCDQKNVIYQVFAILAD